jgi:hypothetical protein
VTLVEKEGWHLVRILKVNFGELGFLAGKKHLRIFRNLYGRLPSV